jgi:hypothetical protein
MNDTNRTYESLQNESTETLILMSELGQDPYRSQALRELRRRKITRTKERLADAFMMLL